MENSNLNNNEDTFLAQWLEGKLSDAELKNRVGEIEYSAYLKLRKGIEVSEQLNTSSDETFNKIQEKINNKNTKVRKLNPYNWGIGVAASVILLFGLFSIFSNNTTIIETGFGETKTIALLDGSEVILNSKSTITYNEDDWKEKRTLTLDGEAYFKVKKGEVFTVITNNGSVKVLGTQFNVNASNDLFDVVCYEGKVGVKTLESDHILLPTNGVRKINGNPIESLVTNLLKPTWIDGESTFKSVPIKYVISELEEQYNIEFDASAINGTTIFSGSFPHKNLKVALKTVFEPLNITYTEKENRNIKLRY
jgi:ferric-dicitrate binding protein FerR (iron transport regulator)